MLQLSATADKSTGCQRGEYGCSMSQRLLKATKEFKPPKPPKYTIHKSENDKMWGYFEEFRDYVVAGDSVNLRTILKACPNFLSYFDNHDAYNVELVKWYNVFIEHARTGNHAEICRILESFPAFSNAVGTFVGSEDIKKQCDKIFHLASKRNADKLCKFIRNHSETLRAANRKLEELSIESNRRERVLEFKDLLKKIKDGENAEIRLLRRSDPNLVVDIANIVEDDMNANFRTMLECASSGNSVYMKYLVARYPSLLDYQSEEGETILMQAVKSRSIETVKSLSIADFNFSDKDGRCPLHISCSKSMKSITKYLLLNGANPDCTDKDGNTPFHLVCSMPEPDKSIMKLLVDALARIDIKNHQNMTCLNILEDNNHDNLAQQVEREHKRESNKKPVVIKNELEKKRDMICRRHMSYSCPCAVAKMK